MNFPAFTPHPMIRGGNAQTLVSLYFGGKTPQYSAIRHEVQLNDGDRVILHDDCPPGWAPGDPVVMLFHGLTGCHQSSYMKRLAAKAAERGWRAFRLDHRGSGAGLNLARNPYHAAQTDDALRVLKWAARFCPGSPITAVGFSVSGNLLLKIAGESPDRLPREMQSLVAICPAIDMHLAAHNLRERSRRRYDQFFAKKLWEFAFCFESIRENHPHLLEGKRPRDLYEFDNSITAPLFGYDNADEYYHSCSSKSVLSQISLETLIVASEDDPLIPVEMFHDARFSPTTKLVLTPSGGHLGFFAGKTSDPDRRWMDWRVLDWVDYNLAAIEKSQSRSLPLRRAA